MEQEKQIHAGHRKRLKKQFADGGLDALSDVNCLELVLFYAIARKDTNPIAHDLLDRFGSLYGVLDAPMQSLMQTPGVSESTATLLHLIPQMARRYLIDRTRAEKIIQSVPQAGDYLTPRFFGARDEQIYLLCLDAKGKLLDCRQVGRGTPNFAEINCRAIVQIALNVNASMAILAHNHVSGIAVPSSEDERATEMIWLALRAVNVELIDHLVIGDGDFVSMASDGFFARLGIESNPAYDDGR